jgi:hypothetical protein
MECVYRAVRTESLNIIQVIFYPEEAVPCLMWLVDGLSRRRSGLEPEALRVRFVVDNVSLGQVFLPVLRFSPVSIIPSLLHTLLYLHDIRFSGKSGRKLGTAKKSNALSEIGGH